MVDYPIIIQMGLPDYRRPCLKRGLTWSHRRDYSVRAVPAPQALCEVRLPGYRNTEVYNHMDPQILLR